VKTILAIVSLLGVFVIAVLLYGWSLPATSTAVRSKTFPVSVEAVFNRVTDIAGQTSWRSDVAEVRVDPGGRSWVEVTKAGDRIRFAVKESTPSRRFVIAYDSPRGFSGEWTGEFDGDSGSTTLRLIETVTVPSVLGRVVASILAPAGAHADRYLADLERTFR